MRRLLITDLDNTLYDWVTFYAQSFRAMAEELAVLLEVPADRIYAEFKAVHQRCGNSEQPFAILELPSVAARFQGLSRDEMLSALAVPLKAFNSSRKRLLQLYPGIFPALEALHAAGVKVVGHTEAVLANSYYRLERLGITPFFTRLYTLADKIAPAYSGPGFKFPAPDFISVVSRDERKPNPRLLLDICAREGVRPDQALYIGDSLVRDVAMAKDAGIFAVWARYGTEFDRTLWDVLVRVTHWTDEDVAREEALRHRHRDVMPDLVADRFDRILPLCGIEHRIPAEA